MPFRFEGLQIWQLSREYSNAIYKITTAFPNSEKYSLANQMNRAANSICLVTAHPLRATPTSPLQGGGQPQRSGGRWGLMPEQLPGFKPKAKSRRYTILMEVVWIFITFS